jgi:hypothetical protein
MKARQAVDLCNNTDIVFECKNLPNTHPVDRLRIGMNDANRTLSTLASGSEAPSGRSTSDNSGLADDMGQRQTVPLTAQPLRRFYIAQQTNTHPPSANPYIFS